MKLNIPKKDILKQLFVQLSSHFVIDESEKDLIEKYFDRTLYDCEINFKANQNKYFQVVENGKIEARFNPYHSVQYMIFLYYLARNIYQTEGNNLICDKIYYLNKIFNGVDIFYAVELPALFGAEHPVGSVLGRAKYSDNFFFYQCCTVGGAFTKDGSIVYPEIGMNVRMFANSTILGKCKVGNNVKIGAGAVVKNQDIPDNSTVFGESPNLIIKNNHK